MPRQLSSTQQSNLSGSAGSQRQRGRQRAANSRGASSAAPSPGRTPRRSDRVEISNAARKASATAQQNTATVTSTNTAQATSTNAATAANPDLTREQATAIGNRIAGMFQSGASQDSITQAVEEQTAAFRQENAAATQQKRESEANNPTTPTNPANSQASPTSRANPENLAESGLQKQITDLISTHALSIKTENQNSPNTNLQSQLSEILSAHRNGMVLDFIA